MEKTKVTEKMYFERLRERVADDAELVKFIDKKLNQLNKKSNTKTKVQKENEVYAETLYNFLKTQTEGATIAQIIEEVEDFNDFKTQKVSALLKKLVDGGRVIREDSKDKKLYKVAE